MATALIRELAVWAGLYDYNIVSLIGFYLSPQLDEAWLVSPFMPKGNLCQYLIQHSLSEQRRLDLVLDTARGLQYLHSQDPPICHGDIKSLNVLITTDHVAVLCDFGLAKTMESMPSGLTTSTFNQAGSLAYESPELVLGTSLRSLESDVWAWACVLQEIFTGRLPYYWANNPGVIVNWITQSIPPAVLADILCPHHIRRLLRCCWQTSPDIRPTTFQCVLVLLGDSSTVDKDAHGNVCRDHADNLLTELEELSGLDFTRAEIQSSGLVFQDESVIGSGVFGVVYSGTMLIEGMPSVAMKRIYRPKLSQGASTSIPKLSDWLAPLLNKEHINLLPILGYSMGPTESEETLLVYPYVEKGNLEFYLRQQSFDSKRRLEL
ncbi:hypothetical protein FRB99_005406, partial [Tulasnella sp. 403]